MSPLIAYHCTSKAHRQGILKYGLLPTRPTALQSHGVYVYTDGHDFDHPTCRVKARIRWGCWSDRLDVWKVAYIGPFQPDLFIENGLCLFEGVTNVSLVTPTDQ